MLLRAQDLENSDPLKTIQLEQKNKRWYKYIFAMQYGEMLHPFNKITDTLHNRLFDHLRKQDLENSDPPNLESSDPHQNYTI